MCGFSKANMARVVKFGLVLVSVFFLSVLIVSEQITEVENQFILDNTDRFITLSRADLITAWHTESHRQCLHQLTWAIDLSCRFDPYRQDSSDEHINNLTIQDVSPNQTNNSQPVSSKEIPNVLDKKSATSFLRDIKYLNKRRHFYVSRNCSWEETGRGCRTSGRRRRSNDTEKTQEEKRDSSAPSVPVANKDEGIAKSSTKDIPNVLSKKSATSFLLDIKYLEHWRDFYFQEECSWEETARGCRTKQSRKTSQDESSKRNKDKADVEYCHLGGHAESCKRHPSRTRELEKLRSKNSALSFLKEKQSKKGQPNSGIMNECCLSKGCFWEEYGEYCQGHHRRKTDRESVCVGN